jgi:hypothetical protein
LSSNWSKNGQAGRRTAAAAANGFLVKTGNDGRDESKLGGVQITPRNPAMPSAVNYAFS